MPLRSVKMNRFIFGFQRRVWCPKCTPLSSSCFMLTTAIAASLVCARPPAALLGCDAGTGVVRRPGVRRRHTPGDCLPGPRWRTAPRERDEDARSRPVGTGRTGQHTRAGSGVVPSGPVVHRPPRAAPPAAVLRERSPMRAPPPAPHAPPGPRPPAAVPRGRPPLRAPPLAPLPPGSTALFAPIPAPAEPTSPPSPAPARAVLWSPPRDGDLTVPRPFDPPPHP